MALGMKHGFYSASGAGGGVEPGQILLMPSALIGWNDAPNSGFDSGWRSSIDASWGINNTHSYGYTMAQKLAAVDEGPDGSDNTFVNYPKSSGGYFGGSLVSLNALLVDHVNLTGDFAASATHSPGYGVASTTSWATLEVECETNPTTDNTWVDQDITDNFWLGAKVTSSALYASFTRSAYVGDETTVPDGASIDKVVVTLLANATYWWPYSGPKHINGINAFWGMIYYS